MTGKSPIPPMPGLYPAGWCFLLSTYLLANEYRHSGWANLSNLGFLFGLAAAAALFGYGLAWLTWRLGAHKTFGRRD